MATYFNCGFARVALYETAKNLYSSKHNWMQLHECDEDTLVLEFNKKFNNRNSFSVESKVNFVQNARNLLPLFHRKWHPVSARIFFSILSRQLGQRHTFYAEMYWVFDNVPFIPKQISRQQITR